jgi:hypothetical protein
MWHTDHIASNLTREQVRTGKIGLASCGVNCLNSYSVFQLEFCGKLAILSTENPHERKAQNG